MYITLHFSNSTLLIVSFLSMHTYLYKLDHMIGNNQASTSLVDLSQLCLKTAYIGIVPLKKKSVYYA